MRKIPTLFVRDAADRRYVTREVTPGCEWVLFDPQAVATRKYDGTCVMRDEHGRWWARREVKPGKVAPLGFVPIETDHATGKTVGWEPIEQSGFARWHAEALDNLHGVEFKNDTYELVGPRVNGNPEDAVAHTLILHKVAERLETAPKNFDGLAAWLGAHRYEGIVWHHPDGRMAKLKKRDFPRRER